MSGVVNSSSGAGSSGGRKKRKRAHERDSQVNKPDYPGPDALDRVKEVVVDYFKGNDTMRLESAYVRHGWEGFQIFQQNMERKMTNALAGVKWTADRDKPKFNRWIQSRAKDATWNLRQLMKTWKSRTTEGRVPSAEAELMRRVGLLCRGPLP